MTTARGAGVASALIRAAIDQAERAGARTVDLTSRPDREAANRLYVRLGFDPARDQRLPGLRSQAETAPTGGTRGLFSRTWPTMGAASAMAPVEPSKLASRR